MSNALPALSRDYPRASGEDGTYSDPSYGVWGLPPRERGRPTSEAGSRRAGGTTPARAGKTDPSRRRGAGGGDYPRASGEDHDAIVSAAGIVGLPPRERGRLAGLAAGGRGGGTTPARAGKTEAPERPGAMCRDYPRASGEDSRDSPNTG